MHLCCDFVLHSDLQTWPHISLSIYVQSTLLASNTSSSCVSLYSIHTSAQYINVINIKQTDVYHLTSSHPGLPEPS
jgi:hypothetical protein